MAAPKLLGELIGNDVPQINFGNFNWKPTTSISARAPAENPRDDSTLTPKTILESLPAPPLKDNAFPLNKLEGKTFMGTGLNVIWRPRSDDKTLLEGEREVPGKSKDVLQFNFTGESTAFSNSIGESIPNRGAESQRDISLNGLSYVQRVGAFENEQTGKANNPAPPGIHLEPGVFLCVPGSDNPKQGATICRMASIPHGTTVNAQGLIPSKTEITGKPGTDEKKGGIPKIDVIPFGLPAFPPVDKNDPKDKENNPEPGKTVVEPGRLALRPNQKAPVVGAKLIGVFDQLKFNENPNDPNDRLPMGWQKFVASGTMNKDIFKDPNEVLRRAIKNQTIESFITFTLSTDPSKDVVGGGTANIGFLEGSPDKRATGQGNAHAVKMTVQYWIETVSTILEILPGRPGLQSFQMGDDATGVLGPLFVAPPTVKLKDKLQKKVTWTQLQYSQNVTLNFNKLSWPHISVATLGETGRKDVDLSP